MLMSEAAVGDTKRQGPDTAEAEAGAGWLERLHVRING